MFASLRSAVVVVVSLVLVGCAYDHVADEPINETPASGLDTEYVSQSIEPGDDFFGYVNEGWLNTTNIPAGSNSFSAPEQVVKDVRRDVQGILIERSLPTPSQDSDLGRLTALYDSYVYRNDSSEESLIAIRRDVAKISDLDSPEEIAAWMARPRSKSIFRLSVKPPASGDGVYVLSIDQSRFARTALGLPALDFYVSDAAEMAAHRSAYRNYIVFILTEAKVPEAEQRAQEILSLETQLATIQEKRNASGDGNIGFDLIDRASLDRRLPGFPWASFLKARGVNTTNKVNLGTGAMRETAALFSATPVDTWRAYLIFHWIDGHAEFLPEKFQSASVDFYEKRIASIKSPASDNERALNFVENYLGDPLSRQFVERFYSNDHEASMDLVVTYIRRAFAERITAADWMDEETREEALKKLDAVIFEVGIPGDWEDWSGVTLKPNTPLANLEGVTDHAWHLQRKQIGEPVSRRGDWNLHPHWVGAGYHQQKNKTFFTAAMMRPPFFDPSADPAVLFGSIGHTIGHELGHAFDQQGARFDSKGALRNWWSEPARQNYDKLTKRLIAQFGTYEPVEGTPLNTRQMIGEIFGDLTGFEIAYRAYQLYLADHHQGGAPVLDGYTGDQRFFMATAQQYRMVATDEALIAMSRYNYHPPYKYRINGSVRNMDVWYRAFNVTPADALFLRKEDRIQPWLSE